MPEIMPGLAALLGSLEQYLDGSPWNDGDTPGLLAARESFRAAVTDPSVLCECVELELQLLRARSDGSNLVPFLHLPSIRAGLAFGYWPPFGATGPHEHTAWTMTAVIRNELEVWIYDWAASHERGALVESRVVHAASPDVGYIAAPTIHDVRNTTADWSLALHLLSDHDGQRPAGYPQPLAGGLPEMLGDAPYRRVNLARMRHAKAVQMARLLQGAVGDPASFGGWFDAFMIGATSAQIAAILRLGEAVRTSLRRLRKIHPDLRLSVNQTASGSRLLADTSLGAHPQIDVTRDFADSLSFVAERSEFDVESLPGNLTSAERQAFAHALADACLFEALP